MMDTSLTGISESELLQKSKHNSSFFQLERIHNLRQSAHTATKSGNYLLWNSCLDKIWSEIAPDFPEKLDEKTKEKKSEEQKQFDKFTEQLKDTGTLHNPSPIGFSKIPTSELEKKNKQYYILIQKEIWLGRLLNKIGKGTAYEDPYDEDIED